MSPIPQPPFTEELLADLHAGNIDPELGARLWPAVQRDPEAKRYLDSLDRIRGSLAALGGSERIARPIPGDIAARLNALAESLGGPLGDSVGDATSVEFTEPLDSRPPGLLHFPSPSPDSPIRDFGDASPGTLSANSGAVAVPIPLDARRRRRRIAAALSAAAVTVVAAGAAFFAVNDSDHATDPTAAPPLSESIEPSLGLDTAVALRALGRNDVRGRLADPAALTACVRAVGIDRPVLGSTDMDFRGREAVLVLVGGRNGAQITALVVGSGCGPGNPEVLATPTDIG
ncbi:hypothetical protein [Nocardia sp. NBC_01329]|uniref:hypothetical protein n=1 Tax=Nocardia sp. NBC_01329 TaxID=2903594 RepID=UPI002E128A63|nr:hypothetical protein OG405_25805 [Nocardia sp. NBC_01329]